MVIQRWVDFLTDSSMWNSKIGYLGLFFFSYLQSKVCFPEKNSEFAEKGFVICCLCILAEQDLFPGTELNFLTWKVLWVWFTYRCHNNRVGHFVEFEWYCCHGFLSLHSCWARSVYLLVFPGKSLNFNLKGHVSIAHLLVS